eukprot:5342318-Pyramimonas_sp.AAC.2
MTLVTVSRGHAKPEHGCISNGCIGPPARGFALQRARASTCESDESNARVSGLAPTAPAQASGGCFWRACSGCAWAA